MFFLTYEQIAMETKQPAVAVAAFATPDRESKNTLDNAPPKKSEKKVAPGSEQEHNTVTPLDGESDKQVRFDETEEKDSKRGLVSRRGGRLGSPAAPPRVTIASSKDSPVLEFKTFRSPKRTRDAGLENDTIPSLCSTNSGPFDKKARKHSGNNTGDKHETDTMTAGKHGDETTDDSLRPSSISCDPSTIATTSPLASQGVDASPSGQARKTNATLSTPSKPATDHSEPRNVTFSPPTPHSEVIDRTVMVRLFVTNAIFCILCRQVSHFHFPLFYSQRKRPPSLLFLVSFKACHLCTMRN